MRVTIGDMIGELPDAPDHVSVRPLWARPWNRTTTCEPWTDTWEWAMADPITPVSATPWSINWVIFGWPEYCLSMTRASARKCHLNM
jgi:hypothetical protein